MNQKGEHFHTLGFDLVGLWTTCFVCGGEVRTGQCIAGFPDDEDSGKRIVQMFQHDAASMDSTKFLRIGACNNHREKLSILLTLVENNGNTITSKHVDEALKAV